MRKAAGPGRHPSGPLGIVSALPEETGSHALVPRRGGKIELGGFHFHPGRIDGHSVVLAEAGVGKVAAALVGGLLLDHFGCRALIFSGVAGGLDPKLAIGDVVIADELLQHDYGAMVKGRLKAFRPGDAPIGVARNPFTFALASRLRRKIAKAIEGLQLPPLPGGLHAKRRPRVVLGRVLSGDQFVNCALTRARLLKEFRGQAVEMEGAALAQVAERFGAPCVVVRCLSDLAGSDSHIDFQAFLPAAAAAAATVVHRLIPVIAEP